MNKKKTDPMPESTGEPPKVYYTPVTWAGVMTVYKCAICGADRNERDEIIEHVLTHVPANKRNGVLDQLIKGDIQ